MPLPKGFDPRNMSFSNWAKTAPVINIPRNTAPNISSTNRGQNQSTSIWSRFNNGIIRVGNWFSNNVDVAVGACVYLMTIAMIIGGIVYIVVIGINEGVWMAILRGVAVFFLGLISWWILLLGITIIVSLIMYGIRLLFWNGWTFLLVLALSVSLCWLFSSIPKHRYHPQTQDEIKTPVVQIYQCTASVLNVRNMPDQNSVIIGKLKRGEYVHVYDTTNGFAHIFYDNQDGYASLDYLKYSGDR